MGDHGPLQMVFNPEDKSYTLALEGVAVARVIPSMRGMQETTITALRLTRGWNSEFRPQRIVPDHLVRKEPNT